MTEITNFRGETSHQSGEAGVDASVAVLIRRVGERVRRARERRGIPRRVLSDMSGVSPRYLAQLEAGEGNISIGLLQRVAVALDHRIEWLVGEDDPWNSDAMRVADLFRTASGDMQQSVLRVLSPEPAEILRARRICLIGLRGAGAGEQTVHARDHTLGPDLQGAGQLPGVASRRSQLSRRRLGAQDELEGLRLA